MTATNKQTKAFREWKGENKAIEGGLRTRESPVWGGTFLGESDKEDPRTGVAGKKNIPGKSKSKGKGPGVGTRCCV